MLTLMLQNAATLLIWVLGALALAVARRGEPHAPAAAAWRLTGVSFLSDAALKTCQNVWGNWAFFAGSGTDVYTAYVRWMPVANHSRSVMLLASAGLLVAWARGSRLEARHWRVAYATLLAGVVAGAALGWAEGGYDLALHHSVVSLISLATLLLLAAALLLALSRASFDRVLWSALALYALHEALNVVWFSAYAWLDVEGVWAPSPWHVMAVRVAAFALLCAIAGHGLLLARRGVRIAAPLDPPGPTGSTVVFP